MNARAARAATTAYFEELHRQHDDPWNYTTSRYEREKHAASLAALPRGRYRAALEIGCSIGVMTEMLADRCDRLLAIDSAGSAARRAATRCRHLRHVQVVQRRVPDQFPPGRFDLIVMSEVGYYLSRDELRAMATGISEQLEVHGHLLLVHCTAHIGDAMMSGDEAHEVLLRQLGEPLGLLASQRRDLYRLDVVERQW